MQALPRHVERVPNRASGASGERFGTLSSGLPAAGLFDPDPVCRVAGAYVMSRRVVRMAPAMASTAAYPASTSAETHQLAK